MNGTPAAFFDLDRTLIRRSSVLALAPAFRRCGLISRVDLVKSAFWQLLFVAHGVSADRVRRASEDGMRVLAGFRVAALRAVVESELESVLRPLVYREAIGLVGVHRDRGERVYVVSATLHEIVELVALDLGFDGAIGSTCEIVDGVYTGRSIRAAHGTNKAEAVRDLAAADGLELALSSAYSDSYTDVPFLETVGRPVAANPDRRLRRIAQERGWEVVRFAA